MIIPPFLTKIVYAVDMFIIAIFMYKFLMEKYYFGHLLWVIFFIWNAIQCRKQILRDKMGLQNK
tara:strand:- start:364 stop:555 length:192 start_codon:yes stop_codon:yes gene_type:complete